MFIIMLSRQFRHSSQCVAQCVSGNFLLLRLCNVPCVIIPYRVRHLYSRKYGAESGRFVRGGQTHCIVSSKPPETTTKTCNAVLASIFDALYPNSAATIPMRSSSHALSVQNQSSTQEGKNLSFLYLALDCLYNLKVYCSWMVEIPYSFLFLGALRHWDLIENRFIKTFNLQSP